MSFRSGTYNEARSTAQTDVEADRGDPAQHQNRISSIPRVIRPDVLGTIAPI